MCVCATNGFFQKLKWRISYTQIYTMFNSSRINELEFTWSFHIIILERQQRQWYTLLLSLCRYCCYCCCWLLMISLNLWLHSKKHLYIRLIQVDTLIYDCVCDCTNFVSHMRSKNSINESIAYTVWCFFYLPACLPALLYIWQWNNFHLYR